MEETRVRVEARGDMTKADLETWSVLPWEKVSYGFLRSPTLSVDALIDAIDGLTGMLDGTFPPNPPGAWWFLGRPQRRGTIPM